MLGFVHQASSIIKQTIIAIHFSREITGDEKMVNIFIIFPSAGSNRGPLTFQANALTTVLLGLLNYPLYVGI